MTTDIQALLQISATLYAQLGEMPSGESRDAYIEEINTKLETRAQVINRLVNQGFTYDAEDKSHKMLFELDQGIKERLQNVLSGVKNDLKDLQNAKKTEKQYSNPYAHVQGMDGMYYDKKK